MANVFFILQLKRLLELKEFVSELAENDINLFLSEAEWKLLKKIVSILRHPYNVTVLLQRVNLTLSDFYAAWLELKLMLQQIVETDTDLAYCILNAMNHKKHDHLLRNPLMQCNVYLDPRVKNDLLRNREQSVMAKVYLTKLFERITKTKNHQNQHDEDFADLENSDENITAFNNLTKYMSELDGLNSDAVSHNDNNKTPDSISKLLTNFSILKTVPMNVSIFDYWEQHKSEYPELYELAKVVFAVPVTQTSVERSFSCLSFVFNKYRGNLSEKILEDIMLIKLNKDLYYEVTLEELGEFYASSSIPKN